MPATAPPFGDVIRLVQEDLRLHKGDWHRPGFRALAVYRLCTWRRQLPAGLLRRALNPACLWLSRFIRNRYGIELPPTASIGRRLRIPHSGPVVLHPFSQIGDDCLLRQSTTLGTNGPWRRDSAPTLGNGVNLGVGASVLGPVHVGDGAVIGPGTVVFFDVPANATVVVQRPKVILDDEAARDSRGTVDDG